MPRLAKKLGFFNANIDATILNDLADIEKVEVLNITILAITPSFLVIKL